MPKVARKVDAKWLIKCVGEAEKEGALPTQGLLWERVTELYNEKLPVGYKPIAASIVRKKVLELNLSVKTVSKKGKKAIPLDMKVLQDCIIEVEERGLPSSRGELFVKVASVYAKRTSQTIPATTLQAAASKNDLDIETPKGKKGAPKGGSVPRQKKAEKFSRPEYQKSIEGMREEIHPAVKKRFLPLVDKIAEGSRAAAVKLKCLDCCGYQVVEIRHCTCTSCALWPFRPFQPEEDPVEDENE